MFDDDVIVAALENIYRKEFNPKTEIEPGLFRETWKVFNQAADRGFTKAHFNPSGVFENEIRYNNAVFSAFRVHRQQNDMAARLLDENGKLKPFSKWAKEVKPIADHYNKTWLQTEYNTAVLRAHQAAQWKQFEAESDVYQNLEWIPSTSANPGEDHRIFWGTIKPINDPFWSAHRPGDRWNCKCGLKQTAKPPTDTPTTAGKKDLPAPGLDNNPADDGALFSKSHPYYDKTYPGAKEAVQNHLTEQRIANTKRKKDAGYIAFKKAKENALAKMKAKKWKPEVISADNIQTGLYLNSKKGIKNLLNHAISNDEIKAAMALPKNVSSLEFVRVSPLGEGKDMNNEIDAANVEKKRKKGIKHYNIYRYIYKGKSHYIKTQVKGEKEMSYTFTKKPALRGEVN